MGTPEQLCREIAQHLRTMQAIIAPPKRTTHESIQELLTKRKRQMMRDLCCVCRPERVHSCLALQLALCKEATEQPRQTKEL